MKKALHISGWGLLISFCGSLPPGSVNIAATHIASTQGTTDAVWYCIGSMLGELIVVRALLAGLRWVKKIRRVFFWLEMLTILLLACMTAGCFIAATHRGNWNGIWPQYYLPPFKTGFLLSFINPLHIPFWLGWTSFLINKQIMQQKTADFNWYVVGIGAGTLAGFAVFAAAARWIWEELQDYQLLFCLGAGLLLFCMMLLQVRRLSQSANRLRYSAQQL